MTTPLISLPTMNGGSFFIWYRSRIINTSGKFTDPARASTRTWFGPHGCVGHSSTDTNSSPPILVHVSALTRHLRRG